MKGADTHSKRQVLSQLNHNLEKWPLLPTPAHLQDGAEYLRGRGRSISTITVTPKIEDNNITNALENAATPVPINIEPFLT